MMLSLSLDDRHERKSSAFRANRLPIYLMSCHSAWPSQSLFNSATAVWRILFAKREFVNAGLHRTSPLRPGCHK